MANDTDITFTIGLNTSPADKAIAEFQKLLNHNDKINTLNTLRSNAISSYSSLMNAGKWVRSGDAYEVQDYERMLRQQASKIRGLDRTLRQSFTISPREFTLIGDSYYNMPPAVIGKAQAAYNNNAFRRDAFNNMMGRAGQNILALPAPKITLEDIELNEFANRLNGNGGRNEFEERNLQKLSLLNERRKASLDFTNAESDEERNDAIKRYTNADQQLKALKDQEKEKKNNAKKEKSSLLRFGNNANDLNPIEDKNRVYLNLLKQKKDAKKKYDESGDIEALKRYTSADQQLKALKDQEKEKKNNAKEEKGSLVRFGKMLGKLYLIKKVLNAIKNIWKRLSDTELKVTSRDVKEKGFFGVDAYSAMHANVDRSHAVISRGLGYMGEAAPFSMGAFDSVLQHLQDLNLKAISGQGIADDQLVISLQRLSDTLGMGFNINDILTDPNLNLTDFLTNLMNSVEKFLPKLNSLDNINKSLVTNDIIKALGPELANALVYNYNYNQRTGGTSTVMEQVISKGTNAYGLIDYTEEAKKFTDALANSRAAIDDFKTALGGVFGPTGKKILDKGTQLTSELTMTINSQASKNTGLNYLLQYSNLNKSRIPLTNTKKDSKEQEEWYKKQENKEIAAKALKGAKDLNDIGDILDYAFYNPTALAAGTSSSSFEGAIAKWKVSNIMEKIRGKKFSELKGLSLYEEAIVKKLYKGKKADWTFDVNESNYNKQFDKIAKAMDFMFEEGGVWDIKPDVNPNEYAKRILGDEEYQQFIAWLLSEENNILQEAGLMKKEGGFGYYTTPKYDEQGNKIGGTITIQIIDANNNYHNIPTTIEDGMLKAMVNVPSS